jgi:hypothetical protein
MRVWSAPLPVETTEYSFYPLPIQQSFGQHFTDQVAGAVSILISSRVTLPESPSI